MEPQLSQLHLPRLLHFHLVAKAGSLKDAARLLRLTPPALTRSLQKLEAELGVTLCARSRAGLTLTEEGFRLLKTTSRLLRELQDYLEGGGRSESYAGIIGIGCNDPVNAPSMDAALIALRKHYPRCKLSMIVANSGELVRMLMSGELDLAVGYFDAPHPALRRFIVGREPVRYYVGKRHPLAGRRRIAERDLQEHSTVWIEAKHPGREELEFRIFAERPEHPMRATAFTNHYAPARRLLLTGQAIVPMPRFWLADELRRGLVRELPIDPPRSELQTFCVYRPSASQRPPVRLLLDSLRIASQTPRAG
jgi:DNA-binding transcriptional LysR family regulator